VFEHVVLDRYLASQDIDLKIYMKEKGKLKQSDNENEDDFDGDDESGVANQTLIF
jgi:hypothetical protein